MPWELIGGILIAVLVVYAASKTAIQGSTRSCPNCGERFCGAQVAISRR